MELFTTSMFTSSIHSLHFHLLDLVLLFLKYEYYIVHNLDVANATKKTFIYIAE